VDYAKREEKRWTCLAAAPGRDDEERNKDIRPFAREKAGECRKTNRASTLHPAEGGRGGMEKKKKKRIAPEGE